MPEDLNEEYRIKEAALRFSSGVSYPGYEELSLYSDLKVDFEEYDEAKEKAGAETTVERSKLLGYGDLIQGEILTECERVSRGIYCGNAEYYKNATPAEKAEINKAATDWILLFQFASVWRDDFELMWGDCGNLYFYIKKQDLAERNFDNIWLVLQC